MNEFLDDAARDDSLSQQLLPLLFMGTYFLGTLLLAAAFWAESISGWLALYPVALLAATYCASEILQRGRPRLAGLIFSYTVGFLPALTVQVFGFPSNPLIYLASLGVIIAALTVSAYSATYLAGGIFALLVAEVFIFHAGLAASAGSLGVMLVLLIGATALGATARISIQGTIGWALDAAAKSNRREDLLRATQVDLQEAIYERERLNTRLQALNRDLDAARIAAESAYRAKASFMATMSHELRTPLNLIIGFSTAIIEHPEMYDNQPLPRLYLDDVVEIRRSSKHLLGLINDILDMAKVEAGRLELHTQVLSLDQLLQEELKTAQGLLIGRPITLRREFEDGLPPVVMDEVRVRQVLLNLLSNASKFTDVGEIGLGARVEDREVVVWVRDTGLGIPLVDQPRIFGEFEQVEHEESKRRGGTGLGLSICRWLIQMHGGRMWVESIVGKGSTFYFALPLASAAAPQMEAWLDQAPLIG
jgi:signal transduction histidine kinase